MPSSVERPCQLLLSVRVRTVAFHIPMKHAAVVDTGSQSESYVVHAGLPPPPSSRRAYPHVSTRALYAAVRTVSCIIGMEWIGMEWIGLAWNGMEWNGMIHIHILLTFLFVSKA